MVWHPSILYIAGMCCYFNHVYTIPAFNSTLSITDLQEEIYSSFPNTFAFNEQIICMDSLHII